MIDWQKQRQLFAYREQAAIIKNRFDSGAVVADVGCNTGEGTHILRSVCYSVVGFDRDSTIIPNRDNFLIWDAERDEFPSKFDVIVVNHLVEHLAIPEIFISKAITALNDNGLLLVTTPNSSARLRVGEQPFTEEHLREYNKNTLAVLLKHGDIKGVYADQAIVKWEVLRRLRITLDLYDPSGSCKNIDAVSEFYDSIVSAVINCADKFSPNEGGFSIATIADNDYPLDLFAIITKEAA